MSPSTRDLEGKVLGVILKATTPLSFPEIESKVNGTRNAIRAALQKLVKDGQVAATGATKARRYSKVKQQEFHTAHRAKQEAGIRREAKKVEDGIARVVFRDSVAKAIAADPDALNATGRARLRAAA